MSEELERLYNELKNAVTNIRSNVTRAEFAPESQKPRIVETAQRELNGVKSKIQRLQAFSKGQGGTSIQSKIRQYNYEVQQFEKDLARLTPSSSSSNPFGPSTTPKNPFANPYAAQVEEEEITQRQRLLEGQRRIDETSDRLADIQRIGFESEQIGASALEGLSYQRSQLEKADSDLEGMEEGVKTARGLLVQISRRVFFSKIILIILVIILLISIGVVVFFKWIKPLIPALTPAPEPVPTPPPPPPPIFVPSPLPVAPANSPSS